MCTVLLPPGVNPIAVNKYIISTPIMQINWYGQQSGYAENPNKWIIL